jgi:hypothetical protein
MEENNVLDFVSALNALEQVSESFKVDAWIPSLNQNLSFKQIDGKQQKELLGAAMDTSVYNSTFTKVFYNIIKNNLIATDKSIVDKFTIADKASIALHLRSKISNTLNVFFDDKKFTIDDVELNSVLEKFKSYKIPTPVTYTAQNDVFKIAVEIKQPTIKSEVDFDEQFKDNLKAEDIKTTENLQKVVTGAFIGEITKYIDNITINDQIVPISTLPFEQKVKLIERLPSNIIQDTVNLISTWKKDLETFLTVKKDEFSQAISIDSTLFLN